MWAAIYETKASLYRRKGNAEKAQRYIDLAQDALETGGTVATTSWVAAVVAFRGAEVSILRTDARRAIEYAETSRSIHRVSKFSIGTLACTTHLLYRAYQLDPA